MVSCDFRAFVQWENDSLNLNDLVEKHSISLFWDASGEFWEIVIFAGPCRWEVDESNCSKITENSFYSFSTL